MTVLAQALRRLQDEPSSDVAPRPLAVGFDFAKDAAVANEPLPADNLVTRVVIDRPLTTDSIDTPVTFQTPSGLEPSPVTPAVFAPPVTETPYVAAESVAIAVPNPPDAAPPQPSVVAPEPTTVEPAPAPVEASETGSALRNAYGHIMLACDLSASVDQGRSLAASLALEWGTSEQDDAAVVVASSDSLPRDLPTDFAPTSEPQLFACGVMLADPEAARRELLVLLDRCRNRFARTVLIIDGEDTPMLDLAASRVDQAVLLAASDYTPEGRLLRAESRLRAAAPSIRPRVVLAA